MSYFLFLIIVAFQKRLNYSIILKMKIKFLFIVLMRLDQDIMPL